MRLQYEVLAMGLLSISLDRSTGDSEFRQASRLQSKKFQPNVYCTPKSWDSDSKKPLQRGARLHAMLAKLGGTRPYELIELWFPSPVFLTAFDLLHRQPLFQSAMDHGMHVAKVSQFPIPMVRYVRCFVIILRPELVELRTLCAQSSTLLRMDCSLLTFWTIHNTYAN